MSQQRLAAANEARRQAKAQQMSAVGDIANLGMQAASAGISKMGGVPGDMPSTPMETLPLQQMPVNTGGPNLQYASPIDKKKKKKKK